MNIGKTTSKKLSLFSNKFILALGALVLVYIMFGQTLLLNFNHDDFTWLYFLETNQQMNPYKLLTPFWKLLFHFFGLNPFYYFLTAFIFFFIAAISISGLTYVFLRKKLPMILTGLFFIFSFVGSENSQSMNQAVDVTLYVVLAINTLILYVLFLKKKKGLSKLFLYILSFLFFLTTVSLLAYRAHPLVFFITLLEIFFIKKFNQLKIIFFRLLPFVYVTFVTYFINMGVAHNMRNNGDFSSISATINFINGKAQNLLATFFNLFVPFTPFVNNSWDILKASLLTHILFFSAVILILIYLKKKLLWLSFFLIIAGVSTYIITFSFHYFITYERYMITVRPFVALFLSLITYYLLIDKRKIVLILILPIIFLSVIQINEHFKTQNDFVSSHSTIPKNVFAGIKKDIPYLNDYSLVILDAQDYYLKLFVRDAFVSGGLDPQAALADYYYKDFKNIELVRPGINRADWCQEINTALGNWKGKKIYVYYLFVYRDSVAKKDNASLQDKCGIKI